MSRFSLTSVALPQLTLEETVDFASGLGYDGVEFRVRRIPAQAVGQPYSYWGNHRNDLTPDNFVELAPRIKALCGERGLAIPALACNATAVELEDLKKLAEGAAICGCPLVRVGAPRRYDGSVSYHEIYAETVEAFGRAIEVLKPFGVRALLEIHGGTITVSASLAFRLVSNFSPKDVGVIYDVQNMVREGFEGARLGLDVLGAYVAHVHVGGHRPFAGERDESGTVRWKWQPVALPEGLLAMPDFLAELQRVGYDGFMSVEDFRQDVTTEEKFASAIKYLRAIDPAARVGR